MGDYLNVLRNHYADFRGRARRREYWMFTLINGIVGFILYLPLIPFLLQYSAATAGDPTAATPAPTGLALIFLLLILLYGLAVFIPSLAVGIRRLHDTGRSGWWWLFNLVPLVGGLVVFIFLVLDSQPGTNKWGPNPKGLESAAGNAAW